MAFDPADRQKLVDALLRCGSIMNGSSRNGIIRNLSPEVQQKLTDGLPAKEAVDQMVFVSEGFHGGLRTLLEQVRAAEGNSTARIALDDVARNLLLGSLPGLGELIPRCCDRKKHKTDFDLFLKGQGAHVMLCGIPGEERECHDSLGIRLMEESLRAYARNMGSEIDSVVKGKFVPWPDPATMNHRPHRFIADICSRLECELTAAEAKDFADSVSARLEKILVLRHSIRMERWSDGEKEMLEWYLSFWDKVNALKIGPRFVILLNFVYPDPAERSWTSILTKKKHICHQDCEPELGRLFEPRPQAGARKLLEALDCVTKEQVMDWFDEYNIFTSSERIALCNGLFKNTTCLPMAAIEETLKQYHAKFLEQRW